MKTRLIILYVFIFFTSVSMAQTKAPNETKPQDKFQKAQKLERKITKTLSVDYLLFLPQGYKATAQKKWPLILFLHGAGERGTNVWRVDIHGPSKYILDHPEFPFVLVTPLCPADGLWSNENLMALLDEVEKKYKVDSERIYLTGLSMGGFGTWSLGTTYPERFAAMAPICGGGQGIEVMLAALGYLPEKLPYIRTLPVWTFHGAKDTVVPASESERMLEILKRAKVEEVKYTVYPEAQHNSWSETYANPELYDWFLQHKREKAAPKK